MAPPRNPLVAWIGRFASRLRYPQLVALTAGLFVLDVLIPDALPFVDEILLGLVTLLLAGRKRRDPAPGGPGAR